MTAAAPRAKQAAALPSGTPFEVLVPIWGERYVRRFAELGLRTLMAPGNLPWLCQRHPVKVTVLTTREGAEECHRWPVFLELGKIAEVAYVPIDDLVDAYQPNYSVVLTRAYNRAMALCPNLLGTNFLYLVGDQLFSNGALKAISEAMAAGSDACIACTPRVDLDSVEANLAELGTSTALSLSNREMVDLLLNFPHPTLVAKTVRADNIRLNAAHQFFWRPAADTYVARCFLLHMLCIRPTRRPPDIAAPCDFSFVTELAPEGRYHYLVDCDAFVALELQDSAHELDFITPYDLAPAEVAESVSAWATQAHHQNVAATFVFRGSGSRYPQQAAEKLSQPYVDALLRRVRRPLDHRHHPFWLGAVGATLLTKEAEQPPGWSDIPGRLRQLVAARIDALAPIDLAVSVADHASEMDEILRRAAVSAVRIPPRVLYRQIEDVAGPYGRLLLVSRGDRQDFLDLFSDSNHIARLLRVAGESRVLLLSYRIGADDLRAPNISRLELHRTLAARLPLFTRCGLAARIHDLAPAPLERSLGLVIEIMPDDAEVSAPLASSQLRHPADDRLYGSRV